MTVYNVSKYISIIKGREAGFFHKSFCLLLLCLFFRPLHRPRRSEVKMWRSRRRRRRKEPTARGVHDSVSPPPGEDSTSRVLHISRDADSLNTDPSV